MFFQLFSLWMNFKSFERKKMRKLLFLLLLGLFALSCGKPTDFEAKIDGQSVMKEVKSGYLSASEYVPGDGTKTTLYTLVLTNFEFVMKNEFDNVDVIKLTDPNQTKVQIVLYGEKGKSDRTTPLKVGDYPAGKDAKNMGNQTYSVGIIRFVDGKEQSNYSYMPSQPDNNTMVKITSIDADVLNGEIQSKGDSNKKVIEINGKFTAKIQKAR